MLISANLALSRKCSLILFCLLFYGFFIGEAAEKIKYTGTFSSFKFNKESGDLSGVEIKIVLTRKGYQGVLQIAEGGPSQLIVVNINVENENISFEIPKSYPDYGGQSFKGKIDNNSITGNFILNGEVMDKEKLIHKHSYWD